ncbi:MAG: hypothetical protein EP149_03510 [Phascolarctobacterium sp.]|nr:hypothetical protein [Phascolarctobacterium sp.]MUU06804.1 hypothetical protein [Phascolarctobacterium sp.]MUU16443.1 hypothetical protein [Phascolarctobacterium sp.]
MKEKETMNTIETKAKSIVGSLVMICPVCGKEFVCNKAHHVYTALIKRKRYYYCRYSRFKNRPGAK